MASISSRRPFSCPAIFALQFNFTVMFKFVNLLVDFNDLLPCLFACPYRPVSKFFLKFSHLGHVVVLIFLALKQFKFFFDALYNGFLCRYLGFGLFVD